MFKLEDEGLSKAKSYRHL